MAKTLGLHLELFIRLRKMLLQVARAIREISRKVPFERPIRLLTSVLGIGVITTVTLRLSLMILCASKMQTIWSLSAV